MKRNKLFVICKIAIFLFLNTSNPCSAQKNTSPIEDKLLSKIFNVLKIADGYSYQIGIQTNILGDTQKTPLQKRINFSARNEFIMYSKSNSDLFFLCRHGQFMVDNDKKKIEYKLFENDSMINQMKEYYIKQMGLSLDSIFFQNATISQKRIMKNSAFYQLTYPSNNSLKLFNVTARLSDGMPEKIYYLFEQASIPNTNSIKIQQHVTMTQYRQEVPDEVNLLLKESKELYNYLQKKYPNYSFQKK